MTSDHIADLPLVDLPAAFVAFHEQHYPGYCEYAKLHLGNETEAMDLVDDLFTHLAENWASLMATAAPAAEVWALLKIIVIAQLDARGSRSAMPETAAFRKVAREVLDRTRGEFELMESSIGLYTAIAALPDRHFDVVVLRYVLGYPTPRAATIMGIEETTVRTYVHQARRKLARDIGLDDRHHLTDPA
ncbi:sigma-70 family RNA polymerase sigma factor [Streptomyces ginkgonis]|uniref:sigma-70 family RNA polymerase sigma factor n=1 Tax=Streptomyces ginkgonis TaxID=1812259 RepID=UPI002176C43B|nr:sigma-70 family RNA polymerase sigma factor [Streptomyces ginkgonis]